MASFTITVIHRFFAFVTTIFVLHWLELVDWPTWVDALILNLGLFLLAWTFFSWNTQNSTTSDTNHQKN